MLIYEPKKITLKQARQSKDYKEIAVTSTKGYMSRKITLKEFDEQELKLAKGGRYKSHYYFELPCWDSTFYHYRVYIEF